MNATINQELEWLKVELNQITEGLFSMYSEDYIKGWLEAITWVMKELESK